MLVVAIAIFCTIGVAAENTLWADHSESSGAHSVLTGSEVPIMQEHSTAAPAGNAPSAPAPSEPRFVGAAAGNQRVELNWTVPSAPGDSSISSYRILRSRTSGAEAFLASVNSSTFDFVDTTVTNGLIYYYTIQAVNDAGPGASSTEAFATPATTPYTCLLYTSPSPRD